MILIFFLSKMVKQKLLENKKNMLKVRRTERNALAISNMSNDLFNRYHEMTLPKIIKINRSVDM